jgi:nicotinate-nucleotide pyrophosphorylase (carboxylating)
VKLTAAEIRHAVRAALAEDIGGGDATTLATVPANAKSVALMRAREPLTVAGIQFAELAFRELSAKIQIKELVRDGQRVKAGDTLLKISGSSRALLGAERVALNFVQRLSGVATATAQFADAVKARPRPAGGGLKNTP